MELERDIEGSSESSGMAKGSESNIVVDGPNPASLEKGGSEASVEPLRLRAEARWARPVAALFGEQTNRSVTCRGTAQEGGF